MLEVHPVADPFALNPLSAAWAGFHSPGGWPRIGLAARLQMRHAWLSLLSLFLLASGPAVEGPDAIRFETDIGPATLDHRGHQRWLNEDCSVCHHQEEEGRKKACRTCHKGRIEAEERGGAPAYFDVKMKLCRGCHLERREKDKASKAPIHCSECHDIRAKANP